MKESTAQNYAFLNNNGKDSNIKVREELFTQLAENSQIWIWEIDSSGLYTYTSPAVENILGYKPEEIVGKKHFYDFFASKDQKDLKQAAFKIFAQKEFFREFINENNHKNGNSVWLSMSGLPILDKEGGLIGYRGTYIDITERKEAQQKLLESEEKYRDIFDNARDAIYIHDLKGKILSINKVVQEYGYTEEQIIGKNMLKFIPKKYWPKVLGDISKVMRGIRCEGEIEVNTPKGKRSVEYRNNPIRRGNKIIEAHAILRDTTDRQKTEEALFESQQKFQALFSANPEATVFLDNSFHVVETNSRFSKLFGYSSDEIKGKSIIDTIIPNERADEARLIHQKLISGPVEIATMRKRKDGSEVPLLISGGPVLVDEKVIGILVVYKNISDIITVQEELSKALSKAEILNEKLSVVGGFTRHDMRNKLATINGNLYLAENQAGENFKLRTYLD